MSVLQINRLKHLIDSQVIEHVSLEEIKKEKRNISEEELENVSLSRAFLLYTLKCFTGESFIDLKDFITDGFNDNGIDAIYYSTSLNELLIFQSKWIKNGKGGVDKGDVLKFIKGIEDLLHLKFNEFNTKLNKHSKLIEDAILAPNIKIRIILAFSGDSLSKENKKIIDDKLLEFNDTDEDIFFSEYNLKKAYNYLKDSIEGEPINADIDLYDWGHVDEPFKSYYGNIYCSQIVELFESNHNRIYSKNIRSFIGLSEINNDIINTLVREPSNFFYLNNGITLICKELKKSPYNSGTRELGKFHLKDLTVINGAQTVGSITYAFKKQPEKVNIAKVFIKIISLENTPLEFDKNITIASNTQNKIEKRDFISLDEKQKKLKSDFYLSGYVYHVKRDDQTIKRDSKNFYFEEATISLACFQEDVDYSTYAKREIGKLWEEKPYKQLFKDSLSINGLINIIKIYRAIDEFIKKTITIDRLVCSHGIYFIANIVFQNIDKEKIFNPNFDCEEYLKNEFKIDITKYCTRTVQAYNHVSPNNKYPLSIFKNFKYCRIMRDYIFGVEGKPKIGFTLNLFDEIEKE